MGIYDLENHGSSPATVQSVSLRSSHGLAMTKAWVTPIFANTLIGTALWPPTGSAWAQRRPAVGAVVKPGHDLNLVFGLRRTTAKSGRSDGAVIVYTAGGSTYSLAENVSLVVAPTCYLAISSWSMVASRETPPCARTRAPAPGPQLSGGETSVWGAVTALSSSRAVQYYSDPRK